MFLYRFFHSLVSFLTVRACKNCQTHALYCRKHSSWPSILKIMGFWNASYIKSYSTSCLWYRMYLKSYVLLDKNVLPVLTNIVPYTYSYGSTTCEYIVPKRALIIETIPRLYTKTLSTSTYQKLKTTSRSSR